MWDVFICHAWEDKETVARPLAYALQKAGLKVWYDESTLKVGDSLRRSINYGLSKSKYGVVILSPYFFAKEWPQRELDGLVAREVSSKKVVLPIWHNVTRKDIERFSPVLADKLGVSTSRGLAAVVQELLRVIHPFKAEKFQREPEYEEKSGKDRLKKTKRIKRKAVIGALITLLLVSVGVIIYSIADFNAISDTEYTSSDTEQPVNYEAEQVFVESLEYEDGMVRICLSNAIGRPSIIDAEYWNGSLVKAGINQKLNPHSVTCFYLQYENYGENDDCILVTEEGTQIKFKIRR